MKPFECEFEPEVLAAVLEARWPEGVESALRDHAAGCEICAGTAEVAGVLSSERGILVGDSAVPDAGGVWRRAQWRARREAVASAGRPITAAQVIAFACAMGLLGACFGATSTWFQGSLGRMAEGLTGAGAVAALGTAAKWMMEHGAVVLAMVAAVCVVPTVFYVALGRD